MNNYVVCAFKIANNFYLPIGELIYNGSSYEEAEQFFYNALNAFFEDDEVIVCLYENCCLRRLNE